MLAGMIPVAFMSHLYSSKNAEAMEKIYSYSYNAWHSTNQIAQITTARELAILNARSFFAHRANQERKKSGEEEIGLARYIPQNIYNCWFYKRCIASFSPYFSSGLGAGSRCSCWSCYRYYLGYSLAWLDGKRP